MAFYGNQYVTPMQAAQRQAIQRQAADDLIGMCILELRRGFIESIKAAGTAVDGQLRTMAHAFDSRNDREEFRAIHQRVGELAQDSVLRSYDQLVTAREGPASRLHYRSGEDRLPNTLRRALARPNLFEASPDGLRWINVAMLNREAAHWHRINFGARSAGGGSNAEFEVTFNNLVVGFLAYNEPASPGFSLPPGFWMDSEGNRVPFRRAGAADRFFPASQRPAGFRGPASKARQTAGIEAKNFLDAGLRRIGEEFPLGYEQHYKKIVNKLSTGQRRISVPIIIKGDNSPFRDFRVLRF